MKRKIESKTGTHVDDIMLYNNELEGRLLEDTTTIDRETSITMIVEPKCKLIKVAGQDNLWEMNEDRQKKTLHDLLTRLHEFPRVVIDGKHEALQTDCQVIDAELLKLTALRSLELFRLNLQKK